MSAQLPDLSGIKQGTEAWLRVKLGVMSASECHRLVSTGEKRRTYLNYKVAQVATKLIEPEIMKDSLIWGRDHEEEARLEFGLKSNLRISGIPFRFTKLGRSGVSPDGLIQHDDGTIEPIEIKCPYASSNHIDFICHRRFNPQYRWQMEFLMYALEVDTCVFISYDPRVLSRPLDYVTIEKDEKKQETIKDAEGQMIKDMDQALDKLGLKWGDQWKN